MNDLFNNIENFLNNLIDYKDGSLIISDKLYQRDTRKLEISFESSDEIICKFSKEYCKGE